MAEPLTSRVTLRREIARDLGMPFFRRFPSGITVQDSATSGLSSGSDSAGIRDAKKLLVEFPFTVAPKTATAIEIFSIHTPEEIHLAINDAITDAFPAFYDVVTYESMIVEEDKLEYELATNNTDGRGVLTNPYRIKNVWIER